MCSFVLLFTFQFYVIAEINFQFSIAIYYTMSFSSPEVLLCSTNSGGVLHVTNVANNSKSIPSHLLL